MNHHGTPHSSNPTAGGLTARVADPVGPCVARGSLPIRRSPPGPEGCASCGFAQPRGHKRARCRARTTRKDTSSRPWITTLSTAGATESNRYGSMISGSDHGKPKGSNGSSRITAPTFAPSASSPRSVTMPNSRLNPSTRATCTPKTQGQRPPHLRLLTRWVSPAAAVTAAGRGWVPGMPAGCRRCSNRPPIRSVPPGRDRDLGQPPTFTRKPLPTNATGIVSEGSRHSRVMTASHAAAIAQVPPFTVRSVRRGSRSGSGRADRAVRVSAGGSRGAGRPSWR